MAPHDLLDGVDVSVSRDGDTPCIDLLLDNGDDAMFEGVVPFVGGAGLPQIFTAKEEPMSSSDDELDSMIVPLSEENPTELAARKRGPGYIGAYSPEERRERIARFHEKRLRRVWKKRVTYSTRKNIANKRMRIKGRFIKKEEESLMKELGSLGDDDVGDDPTGSLHDDDNPFGDDALDTSEPVSSASDDDGDEASGLSAALGMLGDAFS